MEVPLCCSHQDTQVSIKRLLPSSVSSPDRIIYTRAVLPPRNHQISQNRLKENMLLDVNQEIITPRVPHFSAELNVENLCGKQTTQLKVLIANLNGRIDLYCSFDDETKSIIVNACRHKEPKCNLEKYMRDHLTFDWRVYFSRPIRFSRTLVCGLFKNPWFSCRRYFKVLLPILLVAPPPKPYFASLQYRQLRRLQWSIIKFWVEAGRKLAHSTQLPHFDGLLFTVAQGPGLCHSM